MIPGLQIIQGDARTALRGLPEKSVHCVVTSPPYWGRRDYGVARQIGLEPTLDAYVANIVAVFKEVWRVLRDDGTLWVNMGDSYCSTDKWGGGKNGNTGKHTIDEDGDVPSWAVRGRKPNIPGIKPKDLIGQPWMIAFALRSDGWYLRRDIIWHKPNPMPEPVTDRPTGAHEYIFLLTKQPHYYYDAEAIMEPCSVSTHARRTNTGAPSGWDTLVGNGGHCQNHVEAKRQGKAAMGSPGPNSRMHVDRDPPHVGKVKNNDSFDQALAITPSTRNKRSVWTIPTKGTNEAHFATFPPNLVKPCILAGCPTGGTVLDPFGGSGTTALVANELGRNAILVELNPRYAEIAQRRCHQTPGLPLA